MGWRHERVRPGFRLGRRLEQQVVVVVQAQPVQGRGDGLEVSGLDQIVEDGSQVVQDVLRVRAGEDRVQEPAVAKAIDPPHGVVADAVEADHGRGVHDDPNLGIRAGGPHRRGGQAVAQQQVMRRGDGGTGVLHPGGVHTGEVAEEGGAPRLVERRPARHPITEAVDHQGRVVGEPVRGGPGRPTSLVLQGLGEVPVVQRRVGLEPQLQCLVDELVVEAEAGAVDGAAALRQHARPRDGEPVRAVAELGQQREVLAVAVVVVDGHVAGRPVDHAAGLPAERVPDGRPLAVLATRPFDLERRGRGAPDEPGRKAHAQWSLASVARRRAASFSSILKAMSGCSRRTGRMEIEANERVSRSSMAVTVAERGCRSIMASSPK